MKKTISLLLSLVMLLSVTAGMSFSAYAEEISEPCEHQHITVVNQKDPTTTEPGYTGDKVCEDCGEVIEEGEEIPQLKSGWVEEDNVTRYYNKDGEFVKYWNKIGGKWYYFNTQGALYKGWLNTKSGRYYLDKKGVMATGAKKIDGKYYYFNGKGIMQIGWKKRDGKWYYYNSAGAMMKGWIKLNNVWYYTGTNGVMKTGWQYISGKWYYFNSKGIMQTGWHKLGGKWYYMNSAGVMQTGWTKVSDLWYYMNNSGVMQVGWQKLNGVWYYMNSSGKMLTDWQYLNGKWYYFNASGVWTQGYVNVYSKYTTKYSNNANRTNNLKLSAASIDGTILQPGDTFDFNKVVGWRTAERGYKKAPVFLGADDHGLDYGGGVCQTSSTVFNAALLANLQIVERHQHSQTVSYVPLGRDAAISGSAKNMRFKNNSPYAIKISMSVSGGYMTCTMYTVEHVSPGTITIDIKKSGGTYTMRRYANGTCNYTTTSKF